MKAKEQPGVAMKAMKAKQQAGGARAKATKAKQQPGVAIQQDKQQQPSQATMEWQQQQPAVPMTYYKTWFFNNRPNMELTALQIDIGNRAIHETWQRQQQQQ